MKRALTLIEIVVVVGIILLLLALVTSSFSSLIARAEERKTLTAMALLDSAIVAYEEGLGKKISLSPLAGGDGIGPEQLTDEQLRRGVQPYSMHRDGCHFLTTAELTRELMKFQASADIIAKIDPSLLYRVARREGELVQPSFIPTPPQFACEPDPNKIFASARWNIAMDPCDPSDAYCINGSLLILDSWGTPLRAIHPGPRYRQGQASSERSGLDEVMDQPLDPDGTVSRLAESQYFKNKDLAPRIKFVSAGPDLNFGKRVIGTNGVTSPDCLSFTLDNITFGDNQ